MKEILIRIFEKIEQMYIDCPDCENMTSDDQYTCTTCWNMGGDGKINILSYLKENKLLKQENQNEVNSLGDWNLYLKEERR